MKHISIPVVFVALIVVLSAFRQDQTFDLNASIARGEEIYLYYCITCHGDKGQGVETVYPPLAKSDYLMADKKRSVSVVLKGLTGEIKVNGATYNADMAKADLNDEEISDVLNYVRNSFGNKGDAVKPDEVKALRN